MVKHLDRLINYYNDLLKQLEDNKFNCNKCKDGVIHFKVVFGNIPINKPCECQIINNENYLDLKAKKERYENLFIRIKTETPEIYWNADINNINLDAREFLNSKDLFLFLVGGTGSGKTYTVNALKNFQLYNGLIYPIKIIKEKKLNYDTNLKGMICIDDIGQSLNYKRNQSLCEIYYDLIDSKLESNQKAIFTSNLDLKAWFSLLTKENPMAAERIQSRMSNKTKVINLKGLDKRKI